MLLAPSTLVFVALVIVAGYIVFGVTGFGASPITIPLLVHVLPLTFVLPLAFGGLLASHRLWTAVAILLPVAWIGVWIGHRIHVRLAPAMMARIIGAVLLVVGVTLIVRTL